MTEQQQSELVLKLFELKKGYMKHLDDIGENKDVAEYQEFTLDLFIKFVQQGE